MAVLRRTLRKQKFTTFFLIYFFILIILVVFTHLGFFMVDDLVIIRFSLIFIK